MNTFSKFGFILATLGSSIGLGHIWRFPYMAGQMGGGAFVLLFLVLALVIGVSLLITDMVIGNRGKKDVVGCFETLDPSPKKPWRLAGIAIIGGPLILSFYAVILGWILYYFVAISFNLPSNMFLSKWAFNKLMSERIWCQVLGLFACLFITALIVSLGIKKGIEKLNLVLMPLLFIIFIGLLIYAAFQPSFMQAVHFLFDFKYEDINSNVFMEALAQMFFSLSLGVGTIITYAALTQEKQNLLTSALWVVVPGIIISLVAGLIIFTFYFGYDGSLGNDGDRGINLVFISLPLIFSEFGAVGQILCLAFLGALLFAGITSTISLLEPSVFYLTQRCGVSRAKASFWVSVVVFVLGLFAIHSFSSYHIQHLQNPLLITTDKHSIFFWLNTLIQLDNPAFFWLDYLTAKIIMPLSALASIIFLGYIIKKDTLREFTRDFLSPIAFSVWYFIIRYIAPIVILAVFIFKFFE